MAVRAADYRAVQGGRHLEIKITEAEKGKKDVRYIRMRERVTRCEEEIGSLKHRVSNLEHNDEKQTKLTIAVEKLAQNMESMLKEQTHQGERISALESREVDQYKSIKNAVMVALVGGIIGAILTKVLGLF